MDFASQTEVRAIFVVIADVIVHQALQMPFIENDHMVEQIAAAVTSSVNCVPRSKIRQPGADS
jgi:hypothetical protein